VLLAVGVVGAFAAPASAQLGTSSTVPGPPSMAVQQVRQYPAAIIPSLTVSGEYNDNVFLTERNRTADFITGFTPGVALSLQSSVYRLLASYDFTALVYADQSQLNEARARETFVLDGSYRVNEQLTVTLTDEYRLSENTNVATIEGISTGFVRSRSNVLTGGVSYQLDPLTTLRGLASYALERFDAGAASDSDVYRAEVDVDRRLTERLTATAGYQFAHFDVRRAPSADTHTPKIGGTYRITETLTVFASAGPQVVVQAGDTSVSPFVNAGFTERFKVGSASASYSHSVSAVGGLAGVSETDSISGALVVDSWVKDLSLSATPRFTRSKSGSNGIDVTAFNLGLEASYQFTRWLGAVAGYNLFHQTSSGVTLARDVDQNRVFFGLRVGYPIRFD
jgi:hypothetical protein